jgi:hypothetical protein
MAEGSATGTRSAFFAHLSASSLWMAGMSLQGFLISALLVYVLNLPAAQTGSARFMAELPPLLILFLGGVLGDRRDGRRYLMLMHALMALPPLFIALVHSTGQLSYWWVVLFGVLMASIQSLSDPARQSTLSRVAHLDIQRAITWMTIVTSTVGIGGFLLGARLESWGVSTVLVLQSALFAAGMAAVARLPALPPLAQGPRRSAKDNLLQGLRATLAIPLLRNVIGLNFLSSLFNAGAYIVVVPYILNEVYAGTASSLAQAMIVFTIGSIGSNLLLLRFMPLLHPGRLFLFMQLTRMGILGLIFIEPGPWFFQVLLVAWGLNMGVTTTLVRTTVQELAPALARAQVLSILLFSFMVSSPVSALILGFLISLTSPTFALVPGIVISAVIFLLGLRVSGLWQYRSPAADRSAPPPAPGPASE